MSDLSRRAFAKLMATVDNLENQLDEVETKLEDADGTLAKAERDMATRERMEILEKLRDAREELARLSDGCGHGHHHS